MKLQQAADQVGVDDIRFASQESFYVRQMLSVMGIEKLEAQLEAQTKLKSERDALAKERDELAAAHSAGSTTGSRNVAASTEDWLH